MTDLRLLLLAGALLLAGTLALLFWGGPGESGFVPLLRAVPDDANTRGWVLFNDLDRAAAVLEALTGVKRPGADAVRGVVDDYAALVSTRLLLAEGPYISGFSVQSVSLGEALWQNAGYDVRNVRQTLSAGSPPYQYQAIVLDRDAGAVRTRLLASDRLPPPLEERHDGVDILRWDEDFKTNLGRRQLPPIYDELGRGARLAFASRTILTTVWLDGLVAMLDARNRRRPSLAEVDAFRHLAEALERAGAYSAALSDDAPRLASAQTAVGGGAYEGFAPLAPFEAFASGIGHDGTRFVLVLALAHADPAGAASNLARLSDKLHGEYRLRAGQRPWAELFDLDAAQFTQHGTVALAVLPFADGRPNTLWLDLVVSREPLLLQE